MDSAKKAMRRFGKQTRKYRLARGWSQDDLAAELDLDRSFVSGIERGQRNVTHKTMDKLATAFQITISELCEGV